VTNPISTTQTPALPGFVGRRRELAALDEQLAQVRETGRGRFIQIRGRRRVGKSWLAEEWILRQGIPSVFFVAARNTVEGDLARFAEAVASSTLPEAARTGAAFPTWETALVTAATGATREQPTVIVVDEFPNLGNGNDDAALGIESVFQAAWERRLSRLPVIVVLIGSDLAMMERLTAYGRPLYDRIDRQLVVDPLTPADIAAIAGLDPVEAFDAYAVIGGLPAFAVEWRDAGNMREFLRHGLAHRDTSFVNAGVRILEAEFPTQLQPRLILSAVGYGERTITGLSQATSIPSGNLGRSMRTLADAKRIIRIDEPLSAQRLSAPHYTIADPYLRFWLQFVERSLQLVEIARTDEAVEAIMRRWPDARGRLVEPTIREALQRLLPREPFPDAHYVGSYWTRTGEPEIDLIGADRRDAPATVAFVGSIKWRETAPFDSGDLKQLIVKSAQVPGVGAATPLVAISRMGVDQSARKLTASFGPEELLKAYPPA
jgi:AAA+ ATPase superfamily predicted ATPase